MAMPAGPLDGTALCVARCGMILGQGLFPRNDNFTPGASLAREGAPPQIAGRREI